MTELKRVNVGNAGYGDNQLILSYELVSQSIEKNSSMVKFEISLYCPVFINTTSSKLVIDSSTGKIGEVSVGPSWTAGTHALWTNGNTGWELGHDSKGKLDFTLSAQIISTFLLSGTVSAKIPIPDIPRYATSNQSLNSKTETTIKMNWSSDNTIDYVWYSKNNGSSWTAVGSVNATSGSYSITGLTPNTTYNIKTRVRRKDSQLTTDSSSLSVTTYKAPTHSLKSKTETSIVMNWSADSTIDYIWYSKDNGTNWTGVDVTDGTSGTYTISGLSANTSYNVKTRLRRKATQTTYDCSAISITTYNYPHVTTVTTSNLIIGNSQKLTLYNPLSRTVTVKMNKDSTSGTQLYSGTTNSTSITFTPTASTLYASIPSSKSAKCVYSVVYSTSTKTTNQYTYSINEANCIPIFNNFTYADVDTTITSLTDNNQLLVNNNSNCQFTISTSNKATAKNSASIVKYKCEWGNKSTEVSYSSAANVTARIDDSTGNTLKVTAIDSRGLSASVTKTITNIAYVNAVVNEATPERKNGIDVETYLKLKLTLWNGNWKNGSDTAYNNQLKYVGYRVYDGSSWTSYFDITSTVKTNMSSYTSGNSLIINVPISKKMTIHANGTSGGFEIGKEYKIQVLIKDGTSTTTFTPTSYQATLQGTVTDGKVGFSRYKDSSGNYHYAINGMPESSYTMKIAGNLLFNGATSTGHLYLNGIGSSSFKSTTAIIFGNSTTQYSCIKANAEGAIVFSNKKDDNTSAITYEPAKSTFRSDADVKISLGTSSYRWNGVFSGEDMYVTKSSGDTFFRAKRSDTDTEVKFGVGSGGTNHGIWSMKMNKWLVYSDGTKGYLNGNATNADHIKNTLTNPSSGTWYNIPFFSGSANDTYYGPRTNDGLSCYFLQGTASTAGRAVLDLGNTTSTGTAGNKRGELYIRSEKNGVNIIMPVASITSNYINYLPQHTGYIHSVSSLYENASGSTGTITLSESANNFAIIEIYFKNNNGIVNSTRVHLATGNKALLETADIVKESNGNKTLQHQSKTVLINGTSITNTGSNPYIIANISYNTTGSVWADFTNSVKIIKVVGYK